MTKQEFSAALKARLAGLPENDLTERLSFYGEMIDDLIEEGCGEEEAVSKIGTVDEIAKQILSDYPLSKIVKEKVKPKRRLKPFEIVLICVGFPVWFPLLVAFFAVIISCYISIWAVIVSFWSVLVSFVSSSVSCISVGVYLICTGQSFAGLITLSAGLFLAGLSIFVFFGCKAASKGIVILTKKAILAIKNSFVKKEKEQ